MAISKVNKSQARRICEQVRSDIDNLAILVHQLGDSDLEESTVRDYWSKIQRGVDLVDNGLEIAEQVMFPGTQYEEVKPAPIPVPDEVPTSDTDPIIDISPGRVIESPPTPEVIPYQPPVHLGAAKWFGDWSQPIQEEVGKEIQVRGWHRQVPILIGYNIPGRDNGNYSAGGLHSPEEFLAWYSSIAEAIGDNHVWVIVEPDALGLAPQLDEPKRIERFTMMRAAVQLLARKPNTKVFVDASLWINWDEMAMMLNRFQDTGLTGFSCNVSGYEWTHIVQEWAEKVANITGLRYIVDTSRNGQGNPHPGKWCNVTDTLVGASPTVTTNSRNCEAYFWGKVPGESDGLGINDDGTNPRDDVPPAGTMWPEYKDAIYSGNWDAFKAKYHI